MKNQNFEPYKVCTYDITPPTWVGYLCNRFCRRIIYSLQYTCRLRRDFNMSSRAYVQFSIVSIQTWCCLHKCMYIVQCPVIMFWLSVMVCLRCQLVMFVRSII